MRMTIPLILAALVSAQAPAKGQTARPDAATIARLVDSLSAKAVAEGLAPALGVAITMDGRIIYAKSHGMADASRNIPADDRTLWYLASTTKAFTGFGISLLSQRGLLAFDTPITKLLPRVKWNAEVHADSLTLAQFLSHTHHINDQVIVQSAAFTGAIPERRWPDLIQLARRHSTNDLIYSNFGYNVAAMVIDVLRPEGWKKFLDTDVHGPVGMRDTYTRVTGVDEKRIAKPHRFSPDGKFIVEPFFKTDVTMNSAGGHISTLRDLARWTIVQMDSGMIDGRRVFPAEAVALSHRLLAKHTRDQSKRFAFFDREGWAAGWDIGTYEGERMVSRFGSYGNTRSHLSFLPNRRIGAVVMSTGGISALTDIVGAFAYDLQAGRGDARERAESRMSTLRTQFENSKRSVARGDSVRIERQRPLARPLADFTGAFEHPDYGRIVLSLVNGRLEYRWGGLYGPVEIFDASKNQLRVDFVGNGSVLSFALPETGPATALELGNIKFNRAPPP